MPSGQCMMHMNYSSHRPSYIPAFSDPHQPWFNVCSMRSSIWICLAQQRLPLPTHRTVTSQHQKLEKRSPNPVLNNNDINTPRPLGDLPAYFLSFTLGFHPHKRSILWVTYFKPQTSCQTLSQLLTPESPPPFSFKNCPLSTHQTHASAHMRSSSVTATTKNPINPFCCPFNS